MMRKNASVTLLSIIFSCLILNGCHSVTKEQFEQWEKGKSITIMTSVKHNILEYKGNRIHYYLSEGTAKDLIVFLHPAFADHRVFDQQIDFFSSKFRVMTIDLIGHGLSYVENSSEKINKSTEHIKLILEKEGYERAHLVGASMGSLIAQYFALQYPDSVTSLTILGGYDINKIDKDIVSLQNKGKWKWMFQAIFSMDAFRKDVSASVATSLKSQSRFYKMTKQFTRKSFMIMSGLDVIIQHREDIKINYPLLILSGENDIPLSLKAARSFHENIQESEYHLITNAGHCANMDNEQEFNEVVMNFLISREN